MKNIIYVSGARADYGLMANTLKCLSSSSEINLKICVTGMHLISEYGNTVHEIEQDNLEICGRVYVQLASTSGYSMAKAISVQISEMLDIFDAEKPDIVMVLGDRGEMLAAAIAAIHLNIPIIHIHGGERSGSVDEPVRHAISKLSHYHFTATEEARNRLIQMGEISENIYVTGAPGLDGLSEMASKTRAELCLDVGFDADIPIVLMVYHPVVQDAINAGKQVEVLLAALKETKVQTVCLMPNSDAGGQSIREVLEIHRDNKNFKLYTHLPRHEFISWMKYSDVMLGNSSSGIIEAATFNTHVVNIGNRQQGRERGPNIIDVDVKESEVVEAIRKALSSGNNISNNIYGDGNTSKRILELIIKLPLNNKLLNKSNVY